MSLYGALHYFRDFFISESEATGSIYMGKWSKV